MSDPLGPAIYLAADLDGLSRYIRAPSGAWRYRLMPCLCGSRTSGTMGAHCTAA